MSEAIQTKQSKQHQKIDAKSQKRIRDRQPLMGRYHKEDISHFAVTIGQPQNMIFDFFRDFSNLSTFMKDLKEVQILSKKKSHWVIQLKSGLKVEWDAEITAEKPGEMISWQSLKGSAIETMGSVWFSPAPGTRGTVVSLYLDFKIPGGKLAELATLMTGESPQALAFTNLRRLKAYLETGEIPTIQGQSSGREEDQVEPEMKNQKH